jgi:hypothetical protein
VADAILVLMLVIVILRPSSSWILGSQFRSRRASEISGLRCRGSSIGSGFWISWEFEFVRRTTNSANSFIVNSLGLPILIGPVI